MVFLLSRAEILGGIYPFSIAFLGAAAVSTERYNYLLVPVAVIGVLSGLGTSGLSYIVMDLIIFVLLYFNNIDNAKKWVILPASVFAVNLVTGTVFALATGITTYALILLFFEGLFSATAALVFLVVLNSLDVIAENQSLTSDEMVCVFVMLLGALAGLGDLAIFDIVIADVFSRFLVMLAALWGNAGAAAGVGSLMGILPSLSAMSAPTTVGVYAFSGLLSGAFNTFGKVGVAIGFFLGNIMLAMYLISTSSITNQFLTTGVAIILLLLVPSSWVRLGQRIFGKVNLRSTEEVHSKKILQMSSMRIRNTAMIFRELADSCKVMVNNNQNTDDENIQLVLEHLSQRVCSNCSVKNTCWRTGINETYRDIMLLFNKVEKVGSVSPRDVSETFQKRCPHLREMVATINCLYELYCRSNFWEEQKKGSKQFIASQLAGTAEVLDILARDVGRGSKERDLLERDVNNFLMRKGLRSDFTSIMDWGGKKLEMYFDFQVCPGEDTCRDRVAEAVSQALQKKYQVHEVHCSANCGSRCKFQLFEAGAKKLAIGKAQLAKAGIGLCGDSHGSVLLGEGKQMLMLSDGMGVGIQAAIQSETAITLLKRLVEVGFKKETAIETVNTILMLQGEEESFVTLDMCIVDLYLGTAEFIKTGGAPSFIKKDGGVVVVDAESLPVGMIQKVDKASITEKLTLNDMVILTSDGLLDVDSKMDIEWLKKVIEQSDITEPQAMAEYLMNKAISISGGRLKDDITILVAQMKSA